MTLHDPGKPKEGIGEMMKFPRPIDVCCKCHASHYVDEMTKAYAPRDNSFTALGEAMLYCRDCAVPGVAPAPPAPAPDVCGKQCGILRASCQLDPGHLGECSITPAPAPDEGMKESNPHGEGNDSIAAPDEEASEPPAWPGERTHRMLYEFVEALGKWPARTWLPIRDMFDTAAEARKLIDAIDAMPLPVASPEGQRVERLQKALREIRDNAKRQPPCCVPCAEIARAALSEKSDEQEEG